MVAKDHRLIASVIASTLSALVLEGLYRASR
jgi:hypothetical protein